MKMKTCLSIAGSDSSGGAGIQADLKTFAANGVYGMTAITALTAQNTLGVHAVSALTPDFVTQQIQAVFDDIRPDAVKIGMLANHEIVEHVAQQLHQYQATNVVLDPVMIATSGDPLLNTNAVRKLIDELVPNALIITPNVAELLALCHAQGINTPDSQHINHAQLAELTQRLFDTLPHRHDDTKVAILSKGGHVDNSDAKDYLLTQNGHHWLTSNRIDTNNTHGTGCTLSSAICARLAQGDSLEIACGNAKKYLNNALKQGLNLGSGNGPLNHLV